MKFFEYRLAYHARKIVPGFALRFFRVEASDFEFCLSLPKGNLTPVEIYKAEVCASLVWILNIWVSIVTYLGLIVILRLAGGRGNFASTSGWTLYVFLEVFMFAVSCYVVATQRAQAMKLSLNSRGGRARLNDIPSRAFPKRRDGLLCLIPSVTVAVVLIVTHHFH
jgi:hypothetical protein